MAIVVVFCVSVLLGAALDFDIFIISKAELTESSDVIRRW